MEQLDLEPGQYGQRLGRRGWWSLEHIAPRLVPQFPLNSGFAPRFFIKGQLTPIVLAFVRAEPGSVRGDKFALFFIELKFQRNQNASVFAFCVLGPDGENIMPLLDYATDIFQSRLAVIFATRHLVTVQIDSRFVRRANGQEHFAGLAFHRETFAQKTYLIGFDRLALTIMPNPIWRVGTRIKREDQEQEQAKMNKTVNSHAIRGG